MTRKEGIIYEERKRIWNNIRNIVPFAELDKERWNELIYDIIKEDIFDE